MVSAAKSEGTVLDAIAAIVGPEHVLTDQDRMAAYLREPREKWPGAALAVVRPRTTEEVSAVLRICHDTRTDVVPQGGNTGLVGGQMPHGHGREIVLSLQRLDRIREVDRGSNTMTVEAGVTLARVQAEAGMIDRLFPLSLASEGSATIGGNLATNAGGTAVLAYGSARDLVLGLEVALADGRVLQGLNKLRKDNTGYDLKHLFMGSEGTLGIITAAVLKLFPQPKDQATALVALDDPTKALVLLARMQAEAQTTSFELMPRVGVEFTIRHAGTRDPFPRPYPWYTLIEVSGSAGASARDALLTNLEAAIEDEVILDAVVAESLDQRGDFWRIRESLSVVQSREGGSIKHDISVPLSALPAFLREAETEVSKLMPGVRIVAFGHVGDGNLHYNLSQPVDSDKAEFLARWEAANVVVHALVSKHGGSISAEHGIGQSKRDLLPGVKDPVALDLMHSIKATLDPRGILNPNKVLQADRKTSV